jgi:hypothetical protein
MGAFLLSAGTKGNVKDPKKKFISNLLFLHLGQSFCDSPWL